VVSKEGLLESVWGGRIVSDSALTSRVNAARKAVGDSGEAQRLIRTVPRRGFRFIGEVAEEDATRRLAGILAADVVGYSTMIGADKPATLARVHAMRTGIMEPVAAAHGGRLFKITGDGFLGAFASAVQALRCAIAIQERLRAQPDGLRLRIGVHQGEVVSEGDDFLGDGVIIAARLEPLADPGGICISARVREDAAGKLAIEVTDLGVPELKNISARVQVYRVRLGAGERRDIADLGQRSVALSPSKLPQAESGSAEQARRSPPSVPRLSIVVLPFANLSGDSAQEYLADGITENLTTDLSHIPDSFVIARGTAFTYKGRAVDIRQVGRELGIRYALEGSVQRFGTALQVNAQMIDALSGAHLWADRFDGDLSKLPELLDAITTRVWRGLFLRLPVWESRRPQREKPDNLDAVDYILRALAIWNLIPTAKEYSEIRRLLEAAIQIDGSHINAQLWLARAEMAEAADFLSEDRVRQLDRAEERINPLIAAGTEDYLVYRTKADLLRNKRRPLEAIHYYELALRVNPNDVGAYMWIGASKWLTGHAEEGLRYINEALRRSPKDREAPIWYLWMGCIHLWTGDLDRAIDTLRRAASGLPNAGLPPLYLACAYGLAGRQAEARAALAESNRLLPNFTIAKWKANANSDDPAYLAGRERFYQVARELGMLEK
jgi:TolB-like protein/class 3 adenylate cyclase